MSTRIEHTPQEVGIRGIYARKTSSHITSHPAHEWLAVASRCLSRGPLAIVRWDLSVGWVHFGIRSGRGEPRGPVIKKIVGIVASLGLVGVFLLPVGAAGAMGWRTVVVSNLTADLAKGTLKGRVFATDTDLGNATIFTLTKVKSESPTTTYTVKLAPGVAKLLNGALGVHVFSDGMRIGSGATTFLPE